MQISEVHLLTDNIAQQKEFYSKTLSLPVIHTVDNSFSVKIGSSVIVFAESSEKAYYHFAVNIPENKIMEAIEWLKPKAGLIEYEGLPLIDFKNWNAHSLYFYDAAGNIVELIARHNLLNKSALLFSQSDFLCISEAGMPVDDVGGFCKLLDEKLNEKLWSGNSETFAAVGDENGLFIVVTKNRNWFPTEIPSNSFPMKVLIHSSKMKGVIIKEDNYEIKTI